MNDEHNYHDKLHLNADPDTQRVESLLEAMGKTDRDAMPPDASARILDAVSQVFVPDPISIENQRDVVPAQTNGRRLNFRMTAAASIAAFVTLGIVVSQPWKSSGTLDTPIPSTNEASWTLASFEEDLDAFLALEDGIRDTHIDDAVADWELWAQTIEADITADSIANEFGLNESYEGAL